MKYNIWLKSTDTGCILVEANTEEEAREYALQHPEEALWTEDDPEITVDDVEEY